MFPRRVSWRDAALYDHENGNQVLQVRSRAQKGGWAFPWAFHGFHQIVP